MGERRATQFTSYSCNKVGECKGVELQVLLTEDQSKTTPPVGPVPPHRTIHPPTLSVAPHGPATLFVQTILKWWWSTTGFGVEGTINHTALRRGGRVRWCAFPNRVPIIDLPLAIKHQGNPCYGLPPSVSRCVKQFDWNPGPLHLDHFTDVVQSWVANSIQKTRRHQCVYTGH